MKHIPLDAIKVPEVRLRGEDPDANEVFLLANSIVDRGLMHPIVLRRLGDGYELIAGYHRFLAISDLAGLGVQVLHEADEGGQQSAIPFGTIPATDLGTLDDLAAKECEYDENEIRFEVFWREKANALAELHKLRSAQAALEGRTQTFRATAQEAFPNRTAASSSQAATEVSNALILQKHMDDPAVAKAKSAKEALRAVERKVNVEALLAKAAELKGVQTASRHTLLQGNSAELLLTLDAGTVDVLITDPPYGVDAQSFGSQFTKAARFDDSKETFVELLQVVAREAFRVCKPEAHAYVFCDVQLFPFLRQTFTDAGWDVWNWPLVWHKTGANGALPRPEHGPRRQYETILYAIKGDRRTLRVDSDVIALPRESDDLHPHRKPRELYLNLLRRSARPGDTILDPFVGTGVVYEAANEMQLTAIGFELDEAFFALARGKIDGTA